MHNTDEVTEAGVMLLKGGVLAGYLGVVTVLVWFTFDKYSLSAALRGVFA